MLKRLNKWLLIEPFPMQFILVLIASHLTIRNILENTQTLDLWYGILSQIFGGLVVLYNIDSNLKRHGGSNLMKKAIAWLHRCPFRKQNTVVKIGAAKIGVSSNAAFVFNIKRDFNSLESKVDYMFEQILAYHKEVKTLRNHIDDKCKEIEKSFDKKVEKIDQEFKNHSEFISKSFTGSTKWELFGILCIIYGILIPLFPS